MSVHLNMYHKINNWTKSKYVRQVTAQYCLQILIHCNNLVMTHRMVISRKLFRCQTFNRHRVCLCMSVCVSSGTGNTVIEAVKVLIEHGVQPRHIILLSLFSTPHGNTTPPTAHSQFTSVYPAALTASESCFTAAATFTQAGCQVSFWRSPSGSRAVLIQVIFRLDTKFGQISHEEIPCNVRLSPSDLRLLRLAQTIWKINGNLKSERESNKGGFWTSK